MSFKTEGNSPIKEPFENFQQNFQQVDPEINTKIEFPKTEFRFLPPKKITLFKWDKKAPPLKKFLSKSLIQLDPKIDNSNQIVEDKKRKSEKTEEKTTSIVKKKKTNAPNIVKKLKPSDKTYNKAVSLFIEGKFIEAIKYFKVFLNTDNICAASYHIGLCFYYLGNFKEAVPYLERSIDGVWSTFFKQEDIENFIIIAQNIHEECLDDLVRTRDSDYSEDEEPIIVEDEFINPDQFELESFEFDHED